MERVCTDVEEWEDPKWKGYVEMWKNGRIQSGKGRYNCGRMGGSKVERVCTYVEEYEDLKWKGQGHMWGNGEFPFRKGMYIC